MSLMCLQGPQSGLVRSIAVVILASSPFLEHASTTLHVIPSLKLAHAVLSSCMLRVHPLPTPYHSKSECIKQNRLHFSFSSARTLLFLFTLNRHA